MGKLILEQKTLKEFVDYLKLHSAAYKEHKQLPEDHPLLKNLMRNFGLNLDNAFLVQSYGKLDAGGDNLTMISDQDMFSGRYTDNSRVYVLKGDGRAKAGRLEESVDLLLPHGAVSRVHATIEKEGQKVTVTDMTSKNHTYVGTNETEPGEKANLEDMCSVHFSRHLGFMFLESVPSFYRFLHLYARQKELFE